MADVLLPPPAVPSWIAARTRGALAPRPLAIAVAAALAAGLLLSPRTEALSFGTVRLNSSLGQPLDLRIPVQSDDPAQFGEQCLRLLPAPDSDIPTLTVGLLTMERDGLITAIRVRSPAPINEPALRIVLEAGCQRRMQREYVLLLDPPALQPVLPAMPAPAAPLAPAPSASLELGPAEIRAMRGRPLLIRAPVRGADASRLAAECVRTVADSGVPPALATARARLVDAGTSTPMLEITSRDLLAERNVRVVTELGCERPLRREFDVLVEVPPPSLEAETPATVAAAPAAVAPRPQVARATPRQRQAALPPAPPPVPPVAAAAPAAEPPSAAVPTTPATPSRASAPDTAKPEPRDRLVLGAPEDPSASAPAAQAPAALPTDEFIKRLDELATEMKRLRAELDAANQRNAALTEQLARGSSVNIGWAVAAVASLLLAGLLWMSGRRPGARRPGLAPSAADADGPMTRIVGQRARADQAARAQRDEAREPSPVGMPAVAAAGGGGTLMTGPLSDVRTQNTDDIQVTEMAEEEAIRELYADFVTRQGGGAPDTIRLDSAGRAASRHEPGTRFGDDVPATRMTVPLTTQLAVDIDLTPETQGAQQTSSTPGPATATRPLELDLELHLPEQAKKPKEPKSD